ADGPLLATASGSEFSVAVMIPDVPPGLYSVVAVARERGGALGGTATSQFLIVGPGSADAPRNGRLGWSGSEPALEAVGGSEWWELLLPIGAGSIATVLVLRVAANAAGRGTLTARSTRRACSGSRSP
ncbi:MAG TPA: hypothetical protein VGW38_24595, partial [Chloroflexota bacterium]|nr:hypothetical protein [Chloroflexota bacterium]